MTNTALVSGTDRGLGFELTAGLLKLGWEVYAGQFMPEWKQLAALFAQYPERLHMVALDVNTNASVQEAARAVAEQTDHIDMLINNAGVISRTNERVIHKAQDYSEMHRMYDTNSLGPLRVVEAFISLVDRGAMKRLCFVSSEAGSIDRATRTSWFGYCMSKAALNMGVKILFNDLRPSGYTFRLYHPGWMRTYMSGVKSTEADMEPDVAAAKALPFFIEPRVNENQLVLVDYKGQEWPW